MKFNSSWQEWLVGSKSYGSVAEFKRALLLATLSLIASVVGMLYIVIDLINGIYQNLYLYLITSATGLVAFFLNKKGHFQLASILLLVVLNAVVFVFTDRNPDVAGTYFYFLCLGLTAFALFDYNQIRLALFFALLSLILLLLAYLTDLHLMSYMDMPKQLQKYYFILNISISFITCIAIVYYLIQINHAAEENLKHQKELLSQTNAELDQFAYRVSHDLRAPLSSILGLINVYRLTTNEAEKEETINLISGRVHALDRFIRDILHHSRNARLEVKYEPLLVRETIQNTISQLSHMKDFGKQKIEINVPEDLVVTTDRFRFGLIVSNLLSNAVKYYDPAKKNPFIRIEARIEKNMLLFSVKDNGLGIPRDHQGKLFTMFYRAHAHSEGSGLGLYMVREVCRKLGGEVTVQSEYGQGTSFTVQLPVQNQSS